MTGGSLRLRLLLAGAVSIALALTLAAFGLSLVFERHVERRVEVELRAHLDQLVAGLERGPDGALVLAQRPADPRFERPLSGLYWQLRLEDGAVLRSRSLWDTALALPADVLDDGGVHRHRVDGPTGGRLFLIERRLALPARLGGGDVRAAVALAQAEIAAARRAFLLDVWPYLALLGALLIGAAALQVQVGLRPLATLRDRLATIRAGGAERLGQGFPKEIRPLAAEFDALLAAREREVIHARQRAGDLAHGLKTPLQVLAGDAAALEAKGEGAIAGEIEAMAAQMRRHVERELARARLAAGSVSAQTDVAKVVERVVAVMRRTPAGARVVWTVDVPAEMQARIDADDLAEVLGNLVENAARHAAGRVAVTAETADDDRVALRVVDDGPGIPAGERDAVLGRGVRLDERGSGLGLAIVQDVLAAWDGTLTLEDAHPGLRVTVRLPVRRQHRAATHRAAVI